VRLGSVARSRFGALLPSPYFASADRRLGGICDSLRRPSWNAEISSTRSSARTNAVEAQFDLLYEFVQYELRRRHPGISSFTLYRGVRNIEDYRFLEKSGPNRAVVRLNNLNSFSSRLEHAWQFGGNVFEADVPAAKIFFRADLLPDVLPKGEEEAMVIGGDFEVTVRSY